MRSSRVFKVARIALLAALAVTVVGAVVMGLWNWLMPPITGWHAISWLQAMALLVLCRILFGGHRGPAGRWRQHWQQRFESMSLEERERFRDGLRRCWRRSESAPPVQS